MFEKVYDDALMLPLEDRVHLAELLWTSLNPPAGDDVERAWAEEVERRIDRMNRGEVQGIPLEEALVVVRRRFQR
jgi:putative addiction module component (TIGR02574 family)